MASRPSTSPRKTPRGRRHLPEVPAESPRLKAVSFSTEVVETSIGGTHTVAKMKGDPLVPVSNGTNMDTRSGQSQSSVPASARSGTSLGQSRKGRTQATATERESKESAEKFHTPMAQRLEIETENKENVEKTEEAKHAKSRVAKPCEGDYEFASPIGRPTKSASQVREFEQITPSKLKSDASRRTTQDYLDEVGDTFVTPTQRHLRRHTLETKVFETPDCYRIVQMETPRKLLDAIPGTDDSLTELEGDDGEDSCSITVAVRVRPYSQRSVAFFTYHVNLELEVELMKYNRNTL